MIFPVRTQFRYSELTKPDYQTHAGAQHRSGRLTHVFILPVNEDGYVGRMPYVIIGLVVANGPCTCGDISPVVIAGGVLSVWLHASTTPYPDYVLFFVPSRWHPAFRGEHVLFVDVWLSHREHLRTLAIYSGLSIVRMWCHWAPLSS